MSEMHHTRSPADRTRRRVTAGRARRSIAAVLALGVLAVPAAAYAAAATDEPTGTDEDFCLDTPPGVPVNEYNCPVATTTTMAPTTSTAPSRSGTSTPRVRSRPRYTG